MTLGVVEMLLGGVTSFVDMYYFENRCVETVERLGIRAMLGCNYFDSNVDEVMPQVEEAVRLAAGCDRVQIALAPHSPYTVSPENLLRGKRLADKYGLHLMIHISETQDEVLRFLVQPASLYRIPPAVEILAALDRKSVV